MPKTAYNTSLKGYIRSFDFDRSKVDKNQGKRVLINSLDSLLATSLSISAAFKNHGKVNVYFVGPSASAANISSLGKTHISICIRDMCLNPKYAMNARYIMILSLNLS